MKFKRFLSIVAVLLSFLIAFQTVSAATGSAASFVKEITTETQAEDNTFTYPQKTDSGSDNEAAAENTDLRLPDVQNSEDQEEQYGEPVEVDEYTKVFKTGERNFKTVYSEIPNLYKNALGKEIEYDNTLVLKEKLIGADYFTAAASDIEVKLPAEVKSNFGIHFEYDKVKVEMVPSEGDYSKAAAKENAVLYNDVFDGIDVQYTVNALGMKEDIILNKYVDKNVFAYNIDVSGAEAVFENGVLNLYKKNADTPVLTIAAPVMTDADGNISTDISLSFEDDILTITANQEWLNAPERAYPIKIDPNLTVPANKMDVVTVSEHHGRYAAKAYGYVGDLTASQIGVPGSKDLGRTRMYYAINDDFSGIPEGSKINSASLRVYQYTKIGSTTQIGCFRVEDAYNIGTVDFKKAILLNESIAGENAVLDSDVGFHNFDIRQTVNDWIQGIAPQYGLSIKALDETKPVGAFFTPYSSSGNGGQGAFTPDKAPQIIIDWEVPNPVDPNYSLNNTTINLRTIIETNKNGNLHFHGIFADGVAQPGSTVSYKLNDSSLGQDGTAQASPSYKFPDSTSFNQYFPARATKYKDIQSNWQTNAPFTNPAFDTIYHYTATASKDGITGNSAKSDDFLIYKVKQYDVLSKIANYYGVPLSQITYDNRVQDMLLIENNTIIVRNPTKNGNRPYNPEPLNDDAKRRIDSLLVGRGKHCEFGFEPINLNTGNFYMNLTDVSIADLNGKFSIERTYNSKKAGYNSIFGRGWQFEYSEGLTKTADGEFIYSRGDGSSVYFTPNGNGGYSCPDGYYLTFTPVKVGTKEGDFGGDAPESYDVYEYEIKDANGTVKRFNYMGLLVKITDSKNFVTTLAYDDNYNLASITSPAGIYYYFSYTADGMVSSITMPNGKLLSYKYDGDNNLTSFTDGAGNTTRYSYDGKHQMTSWSDGNDVVVNVNEYDSEGRVTKQTDGNGNVTLLSYAANQTTTTDANGNVTIYHYDDNYRTTKIEYANGSFEENVYDENNNLVTVIDRNGTKTNYEYDSNGNVVKETRFDGTVKSYTYDTDNYIVKMVDFNGATTNYTYTDKNLTSVKNADGSEIQYEYDSLHRLIKTTDSNKNVTTYEYNNGVWLTKMVNSNGGVVNYYYNNHGQIVSVVDALEQTTRFVYDDAGRKIQQQTSDGAVTKFGFDAAGNTVSMTDANGNQFTFEHDANGNVIKATDPYGDITVYTYDGLNNKLTETDPSGKMTSFAYDCFSNIVSSTDADGKTRTYEYDNIGNQIKVVEPKGNTSVIEYDLRFNKVSKITDAANGEQLINYDAVGNVVATVDTDNTETKFVYDYLNRVVESTTADHLNTKYTYDSNGNLLTSTDNTGRITSYTYDSMNNMLSTTLPNGAVLTYEYDLIGRLTSTVDSLQNKTTYAYNSVGRLLSSTDSLGRTTQYEYDGMGNALKYVAANQGEMSYEYDKLDRIKKVTDALGNYTSYAYDKSENLAALTDVYGNATSYEYNGRNLVTKITDALGHAYSFTYDDNGNQVEAVAPDGTKVVMEYDGKNRLVKSTDTAGLITTYEYNALGQLIAERNNADRTTLYSYDTAGRISTITNALDQTVTYTYDARGNIAAIKETDGNTTKYTYDSVGNIISSEDAEGKVTTYTYDLNGNLLSKEDSAHRMWKYYYDSANRLVSTQNPLDETTAYEYNAMDFILKTTDAKGVSVVNEYDLAGNLLSKTDGNNNKTSYEYDALYRLISATAADGGKQEYLYDAVNNLTAHKDALGNVTTYSYDVMNRTAQMKKPTGGIYKYSYDAHGNQASITDPLENTTELKYDLNNSLISKTLANGAEYTYAYDAIGRITAQTAPEGLAKTYTYDEAGNLSSETDQSNRTTTYVYDQMHKLLSSVNPQNATTNFGYDNRGNLTSIVIPKGNKTSYEYDVLDRISKSLDPVGKTEEYRYDAVGNVESITKTGGRVYTFTYDNVGNMLSVTNPLEQVQSFAYDSMNRKVSETDLEGKTQSYTYDYNGQLKTITNKLGGISSFEYDGNGNMISAKDAENREAGYTYDLNDRLISVTEDTSTTTYKYDSVGNLVEATNGNGKSTTYTYNLLGDMTSITDPLGKIKQFSYDVNAQLQTVTNPDGTTVDYDYDKLDQLIEKSYDETDVQAMYGYDADGNRISMNDVAGTTDYVYDAAGRITSVYLYGGKEQIKYTYDKYGNLYELMYPDGSSVQYDYDKLDRLIQISDRDNKITSYEYDANGNIIKITRPNNTYTDITYDDMGNVLTVKNMRTVKKLFCPATTEEISSFSYSYDLSGFITSELAKQDKKIVERTFAYDGKGQISAVTEKVSTSCGVTWELSSTFYTYDNAGNRTKEEVKHGTVTMNFTDFVYNDADQLIDRNKTIDRITMNTHYSYDANGNLIQDKDNYHCTAKNYTYDNENRLQAVKSGSRLLMAALYNGDGDRIFTLSAYDSENYQTNGRGTALDVYSGVKLCGSSADYDREMVKNELLIPNDVTVFNATQYELTGYINNINGEYTQTLMEFGSNGKYSNVYDYGAQRNSIESNGLKSYYAYDGRGSVANLTGKTGANVVSYNYDIYGEATASKDGINNAYLYNAEYVDGATGMQYLRARYYDSETSRFLTKDTYLGETNDPLSRNQYTYTRNNPINLTDPSGHFIFSLIVGTIAVGAAIYGSYKAVKNHNEQSSQIRNQQQSYEQHATVRENVKTEPTDLKAPTNKNQKGNFSYYNKKDKKVVTFTNAAAYFEYKKLCEDLEKLDKKLVMDIVHNSLDAVGVIPGVGEAADALNGTIYLAEGDYLNASLSYVSCIPLAGDAAGKGGKALNTAIDYSDEAVDFISDAAKHGDDAFNIAGDVAKKTDYNSLLQEYADKANDIVNADPLKNGRTATVQGTYKHSELENMVTELNDPHLKSEQSFLNGADVSRGTKDSIRLDNVQYDDAGKIVNVWDLKTGKSGLTDKRKQQIFDDLSKGDKLAPDFSIDSIHELRPRG